MQLDTQSMAVLYSVWYKLRGKQQMTIDGQPNAWKFSPSNCRSCNNEPTHCTTLCSTPCRRLWNSGLTCAFLASLIFSFSALCVKLTGGRIPVLEVCFIRSSISFGLTIVLMKSTGMSPIFGQRKNLRLLFMRGCCGACSMVGQAHNTLVDFAVQQGMPIHHVCCIGSSSAHALIAVVAVAFAQAGSTDREAVADSADIILCWSVPAATG